MAVTRAGARRPLWLAEERWERLAPWSGVLGIVLICIGFIVQESADRPRENAGAQEVLTYFQNEQGAVLGGSFLVAVGLLCVLWFLGSLRSRLAWAEGGVMRLASVAFAAGVAMVTLMLAAVAPELAGALAVEDEGALAAPAAQALSELGEGFFLMAWFPAAALLAATAVVALRTGAFPWWLGWVSIVMAVALLIPWIGWAVFLFLLPIWIIFVAVWMWRRPERGAPVTGMQVPPAPERPAA